MALLTPSGNLYVMAVLALCIAICSATQDIAIDAYRIDIIADDAGLLIPKAASLATAGWWTGYGGIGALPFILVDITPLYWQHMYLVLALIMALLSILTLLAPAVTVNRTVNMTDAKQVGGPLAFVVAPFQEFFSRNGTKLALNILLFIFLFKIGEAFLGRMSIVFYKEIGFSNSDIGTYSKLLNWWVTVAFSLIGGWLTTSLGIYRGLLIAGVAMAASNLMFALIASTGPSTHLLAAAVFIDGFTSAWSTVSMVAFISLLCHQHFSATQYAMMASISTAGRTLLASSSGGIVDALDGDWALFFVLTALMVIPSLWLLIRLGARVSQLSSPSVKSQ
jgi:PAT family beta-lactamase induction signal transducer AmpG